MCNRRNGDEVIVKKGFYNELLSGNTGPPTKQRVLQYDEAATRYRIWPES